VSIPFLDVLQDTIGKHTSCTMASFLKIKCTVWRVSVVLGNCSFGKRQLSDFHNYSSIVSDVVQYHEARVQSRFSTQSNSDIQSIRHSIYHYTHQFRQVGILEFHYLVASLWITRWQIIHLILEPQSSYGGTLGFLEN
jgi:hypothetical protein